MGTLLIRLQYAWLRTWHGHGRRVIGKVLVQDVEARAAAVLDPFRLNRAVRWRGPHTLHVGLEAEGQCHGSHRLYLVEDQDTGAVRGLLRRHHDLAYGEVRVRVCDRRAVGPDFDPGRMVIDVDWNRIAVHIRSHAHAAEDLPGKDPCLVFA